MSAASCLRSKDQFLCSICLDVFTDPVSTPCGHNFCKDCITGHWDTNVLSHCPVCREVFTTRPQLRVNIFISEMVSQFKHEAQQKTSSSSSEQQVVKPGEVPCDVCTGTKLKALKSCLVCLEEQLSHSEDHLHLLQSFSSLKAAPPTKDWTEVRVHRPSYEGTVVRAVPQLVETLSEDMKKLFDSELKRVQQFAVDVTLDPDTAQPKLILSEDGKQVHHGDVKKNVPDNPQRFSPCPCLLAKQSFSSGRFYFEVQVKGKTRWTLGVVRESINRKGDITLRPQNGFWTISLREEYQATANQSVCLPMKTRPEKVGVFVDYEEGLVSFYDVDAAALIYSFTGCCFKKKLYPYFCPGLIDDGKNSAPLIICPVNKSVCSLMMHLPMCKIKKCLSSNIHNT